MSTSSSPHPFLSSNFELQVQGIVVGAFSEVSGLSAETEIEDYKEGGENDFVHKLLRVTKYGPLVCKNGLTNSRVLYDWYKDVVNGKIDRKQVTVTLLNAQKSPLKNWVFKNAFPIKWTGPDLKSDSNTVALESVELVHQGLVWI